MAEVHKTAATLRFHGDDLDPDKISRALGSQPTKCAKRGGIWLTPNGSEIVARRGFWHLSTTDESPGDLDKQISALFFEMNNDFDVWRALAARFGGNIFVGVFLKCFNEGLGLLPATMSAIGLRGLELDLDIYSGDDHQEAISS